MQDQSSRIHFLRGYSGRNSIKVRSCHHGILRSITAWIQANSTRNSQVCQYSVPQVISLQGLVVQRRIMCLKGLPSLTQGFMDHMQQSDEINNNTFNACAEDGFAERHFLCQ